MEWWHLAVIALGTYLLLCLGPWLALNVLHRLLQRAQQDLVDEEQRLRALTEEEEIQRAFWPAEPRPGRYEEPDRMALESLEALRARIADASRFLPIILDYVPATLTAADVLLLRAWPAMVTAWLAMRSVRSLQGVLDQGSDILFQLQEQQGIVGELPSRVRALLNEQRAEARRLDILLEEETDHGTLGLEDLEQELSALERQINQALDALSQAPTAELPRLLMQIDSFLDMLAPRLKALDPQVEQARADRTEVERVLARLSSAMGLAQERWKGLQDRGATEPSVSRSLVGAQEQFTALDAVAARHTVQAYRQVLGGLGIVDEALHSCMGEMDHLDDVMTRSKEAAEGSVTALADAQAACDAIVRQDVMLDPDRSRLLIEQATRQYVEAERQRGLGTLQGYETAIELSGEAAETLARAQGFTESFADRVRQVRELLDALQPGVLGDCRQRAERLHAELRIYTRHWDKGLGADTLEAISQLDQVEVELERIAPNVRYQRRLRESEIDEALDILQQAHASFARGQELLASLEEERERLNDAREEVERRLGELSSHTLPQLRALGDQMVPEMQQRLGDLLQRAQQQTAVLLNPSQTDYDEALQTILPPLLGQMEQMQQEHERQVAEYENTLRDAVRQLERRWSRLLRLRPQEPPGPEEDIERLGSDLESWGANAEKENRNLPALRDLLGRPLATLEQRIENAERQIVEGRRALDSARREYRRHAETVRDLRARLRDLEQRSQWRGLAWDMGDAERAWQRAIALEHDAEKALALTEADDAMQRAIKAAVEAEELYDRSERHMSSAVRHLDDELRAIHRGLERTGKRVESLRTEGATEEAAAIEEAEASGQSLVQLAVAASSFEEALRYLREARKALEG